MVVQVFMLSAGRQGTQIGARSCLGSDSHSVHHCLHCRLVMVSHSTGGQHGHARTVPSERDESPACTWSADISFLWADKHVELSSSKRGMLSRQEGNLLDLSSQVI